MKWMKERDLLIAQTMAFVQSVTGKPPEAARTPETAKTIAAPDAPFPVETFEPARPAAQTLSDVTPLWLQTPSAVPAPTVIQAPVSQSPAIEEPAIEMPVVAMRAETPLTVPRPTPLPRVDLREDFQSEIRARVANFRAHQERFTREREAYCAATMAKVHAVLKESELPPPQTRK